jgi:hypothetical protein
MYADEKIAQQKTHSLLLRGEGTTTQVSVTNVWCTQKLIKFPKLFAKYNIS